MTNTMTLETIAPEFKEWLGGVASANDKTLDQVFGMWKQYARDCSAYDQSPVKSEFLQWNTLEEATARV
jgi:hypothetical protein